MDLTAEQLDELGKSFSKRAKAKPLGKGAIKTSFVKDLFKQLVKDKVSNMFGGIVGPFSAVMEKVKEFRDSIHEKEVEAAEEYVDKKREEVKALEEELKDTTKSEDELKQIQAELDDARKEAMDANSDLFKLVGDDLEEYLDEKKKESKDLEKDLDQVTKLERQKENMLTSLTTLSEKERKILNQELEDLAEEKKEIEKELADLGNITSSGDFLTGNVVKPSKAPPSTTPTSVSPPPSDNSQPNSSDSVNEIVKATVAGFKDTNKNLIQLRGIWGDKPAKDDLSKIDPKLIQYVTENTKQFMPEIIKGMEDGIRQEMEEIRKTDPAAAKELEKILHEIVKTNTIVSSESKMIENQTILAEQTIENTKTFQRDQKRADSLRTMELKETLKESSTKTIQTSTRAPGVKSITPPSGIPGKSGILGALAGMAIERFLPGAKDLGQTGGLLKNVGRSLLSKGAGLLKNGGGSLLSKGAGLLKNGGGSLLSKGAGLASKGMEMLPSLGNLSGLASGAMKLAGPAALALGIGKGLYDYSNESEDQTKERGGGLLSSFGRIGDSITGGLATTAGEKLAETPIGDNIGYSITRMKSFFGDQDATNSLKAQEDLAKMNSPEGKAAAIAQAKANMARAKTITPESPKDANTIVPTPETVSQKTQALETATTENQTLKENVASKPPIIISAPTTNVGRGNSSKEQSLNVAVVRNQEGTLRRMLDCQYAI